MPRSFGKYRDLPTAEEAFRSGLETGKNWQHKYMPGGPWVCTNNHPGSDVDWNNFCAATRENNTEWQKGFSKGLG